PAKTEVRFRDPDSLFGLILRTIRERLAAAPGAEVRTAYALAGAGAPAASAREPEAPPYETPPELAFELPEPGPPGNGRAAPTPPAPRFIQAHRSYVVAETADGIRIFDQHALHERKLFDELLERFARSGGEDQLLLVPFTVDLEAPDRE